MVLPVKRETKTAPRERELSSSSGARFAICSDLSHDGKSLKPNFSLIIPREKEQLGRSPALQGRYEAANPRKRLRDTSLPGAIGLVIPR